MVLELERVLYDLTPDLERETYIQNQEHVQEILLQNLEQEHVQEVHPQNQERAQEQERPLHQELGQDLLQREAHQEVEALVVVEGKEVKNTLHINRLRLYLK